MGKKETKQQLTDTKSQAAAAQTQFGGLSAANTERQGELDTNAAETRTAAKDAYTGFLTAPPKTATHINPQSTSFDPISYTDQHLTASKVDPAAAVAAEHSSLPGYTEMANTGGYDTNQRAAIGGDVSNLRNIGLTGSLDAEAMQRMRGNGVYDEFAKTG